MKRAFGVVHAVAECKDCGWTSQQYKNAQATAAIHARKYKHVVSVEVGIEGYYDGREVK